MPPKLTLPEISEVHVSVAFTYDMRNAEYLAEQWRVVGVPVHMGGPAFDTPGGNFVPGRYLKPGYVVTSRGCPNRCRHCSVPEREGYQLRELPVTNGWNIIDDNLLACSEAHIRAVFEMLSRQPEKPLFTGGLESKRLKPWHVDLLRESGAREIFFAYDTPAAHEPLVEAGKLLRSGGIEYKSHAASCYVLIGFDGDTFESAEKRLKQTVLAGFRPHAMLYRDRTGIVDAKWSSFQREWARPQIVGVKMREILEEGRCNFHWQ